MESHSNQQKIPNVSLFSQDKKVLRKRRSYKSLHFYQKSDAIFQLTFIFCQRFLLKHGDRTVDQMIQAARSGKQNIVEGIEDGETSSEMELKLLNVARGSLQELREDYEDYLHTRCLTLWQKDHARYQPMLTFCQNHNLAEDFLPFASKWTAEEFCNTLLTLCHITDRMLSSFLQQLERTFVEQGGIKERMHAARTGFRQEQDKLLQHLQAENAQFKQEREHMLGEHARLQRRCAQLQEENTRLQEECARLQEEKSMLKAEIEAPLSERD